MGGSSPLPLAGPQNLDRQFDVAVGRLAFSWLRQNAVSLNFSVSVFPHHIST